MENVAIESVVKAPAAVTLPAPRIPLRLTLREVEIEKLHMIDIEAQSFKARMWLKFVVKSGASDAALADPSDAFPIGSDDRPTYKPSLAWFVKQVDFPNALNYKIIDSQVLTKGHDLEMLVRVDGMFTEIFELAHYPFDNQGLTMMSCFNCRVNGPMPIEIDVDNTAALTMTCIRLCPPNREWIVEPVLHVSPQLIGTGDRSFPGISFTTKVTREPFYYLVYFAAPFGIFSMLAVLTTCRRSLDDVGDRAQNGLVLTLTVATYRIAIGRQLPRIAYLTMLDYYSIACVLIILLVTVESHVLILLTEEGLASEPIGSSSNWHGDLTGNVDVFFDVIFVISWLWTHGWFVYTIYDSTGAGAKITDANLLLSRVRLKDKSYDGTDHVRDHRLRSIKSYKRLDGVADIYGK